MTGVNTAQIFLFDLDGTLADSLATMRKAYNHFAELHGFKASNEEFDILNGPSLPEIIDYLKDKHSLLGSKDELLTSYNDIIREMYITNVQPHSMATDLLKTLHAAGKRLFLVTSSPSQIAAPFLDQMQWGHFFESCVYGDEVQHSKPSGDIYRLTVGRHNLSPADTLVVEDSVNGVLAARDAGLTVIGTNTSPTELLSAGAFRTYSSLEKILDQFRNVTVVATSNIEVQLEAKNGLPESVKKNEKRIDILWQDSLEKSNGGLFDAPLCFLSRITEKRTSTVLSVVFGKYRQYKAQREGLNLGLTPIGVSGLILTEYADETYVVLAQRASNVEMYPGALELVPSGSIDHIGLDASGKLAPLNVLRMEYEEETGLPQDSILETELFALIKDNQGKLIDLCYYIRTDLPPKDILSAMERSEEYEKAVVIPISDLLEQLNTNTDLKIVPTSITMAEIMILSGH